jgi:hypothetical protein
MKAQTTQARVILSGAAWGPAQRGKRSEGSAEAQLTCQNTKPLKIILLSKVISNETIGRMGETTQARVILSGAAWGPA